MNQKILRKAKRIYRQINRSLSRPTGRTFSAVWGESQVRKIKNLGQEIVVMRMG